MKHCPRCSSDISDYDKQCPRCGLPVNKMEEFTKNFSFTDETVKEQDINENEIEEKEVISKKEQKKRAKAERKAKKKADKKAKEDAILNEDTQFYVFAKNSGVENPDEILETDTYMEKRKKKKRQAAKPVFVIDKNGDFHISTSDVEVVGEEASKMIDKRYEQSYSIKKERGDYIPPKIKWWEIYKLADRYFVRRKIKKEVNKAAKVKPKFVKKSKLALLCFFFGYIGVHNFYVRNKKKAWFTLISFAITLLVNGLAANYAFFSSIQISIGGGFGFIAMFIWISDFINILTNQFKYKIQRDKFIALLNIETRAKLGEKYIDMDLYRKPWWVRFKVWLEKTKRNYAEYKRDKRQRNIDKQKRKLEEQEKQNQIERDIAEFERKENEALSGKLSNSETVSQEVLDDLKSFGEADEEETSEEVDENAETIEESSETETSENVKKKGVEPYNKKYAKFSTNKKKKKK